jgi:D-arabinose 1-dehydrogenase-like Zn-dependent alcohol dehydrogenase
MKAVRLLEYGGQLVFNDVPTLTIARDEILVKIRSTAVNHLDLVEASGTARQILPIDLPWIPGHGEPRAVATVDERPARRVSLSTHRGVAMHRTSARTPG